MRGKLDRRFELEPQLLPGYQQVESFGIDTGHDGWSATGVTAKRVGVVFVHVFDDPQFLLKRKRILRHEFARFHPVDLPKSADESHADKVQAEKREVVGLFVLSGRRKVAEVSLSNLGLMVSYRLGVCDARHSAMRLYVV